MELKIGLMNGIESFDYGNPYEVMANISEAKESELDILVGPEWSLNSTPGVFSKSALEGKSARKTIDTLFNAPDYSEYAPRDAKKLLEEQIDRGVKKFDIVPRIPYSKREYNRVVDALEKHSKNSDMLIVPGTAVFYDSYDRMYNAMPIIKNGKTVRTFYKFQDGFTSRFNLNDTLRMYPAQSEDADNLRGVHMSYGRNPKIKFRGLDIGVEICADGYILKDDYKIDDLDLQILSSCGNNSTVKATNSNGYLAVVDGYMKPEVRVSNEYVGKLRPTSDNGNIAVFDLEFKNQHDD